MVELRLYLKNMQPDAYVNLRIDCRNRWPHRSLSVMPIINDRLMNIALPSAMTRYAYRQPKDKATKTLAARLLSINAVPPNAENHDTYNRDRSRLQISWNSQR
ncbi:hypothetical protein V3C99_005519 [Haemonchus contortus]